MVPSRCQVHQISTPINQLYDQLSLKKGSRKPRKKPAFARSYDVEPEDVHVKAR